MRGNVSPVRFHKAERVNFNVMSTWLDSILVLTIANNLRIYFGVEPRTVVSEVEILAASIEHMATLMRPIDESSKMHKQSSTNRAQRNRSKVTS